MRLSGITGCGTPLKKATTARQLLKVEAAAVDIKIKQPATAKNNKSVVDNNRVAKVTVTRSATMRRCHLYAALALLIS